jgi:putative PEP-CTERM system TPR-repeat lipoprotein
MKIPKKFLAFGAAMLIAGGLLVGCDHKASTDELVSRAEQFITRGDYRSATIELKNAVAADTENARARWLLGKVYFESGELEGAAKELQRANELGMAKDTVLPLLAQSLLPLGRHDELMSLGTEGLVPDAQAQVLAAQGLSLLGKGELEEAGKRLEQALATDADSAFVRVAHARLLLTNGQMEAGRKQLDEVVDSEPGYAPAWSLLGDLAQQQQHPDVAEKAYSRALEADPDNVADLLKRALIRIQARKAEQAAEDVAALKKLVPGHPGVHFAEGLLHLQKNELDEAKTAFELAVRGGNTYPFALFYLAGIHAQQGNPEQAQVYASQFLAIAPDNAAGRNLAGGLAMRAGDFARAETLVRPVIAANGDDVVALNLLSASLIAQGKTDEGLDILTRVAQLQPDSAMAQTRLAAGLLATGQGGVGIEHLQRALELDPKFQQADVLLVLNQLREGNLDGAIRAAQAYRDRNPEAATPYNLLGRVYLAGNDQARAREAFVKALELAPGDPGASQGLAALAVQAKDYDAARGYFDGVLAKHPDYLPAHMQLAALDLAQGDEAGMVKRLQTLVEAYPGALEPRMALARYHIEKGRGAETLSLLGALDDAQKKQPDVMSLIAAAQLSQNQYDAAKAAIDRLVTLQPNVAQHHYQLAIALAGLGDTPGMRKELEKTLELDPKHFQGRIAMARTLSTARDKEAFEAQVKVLREMQPEHPDVLSLEASLAKMKGNNDEVLAKLEKAYAVAPTTATLQNLAVEKLSRGDASGGIELLKGWIDEHPQDMAPRMVLAEVYAAQKRDDKVVEQYKAVVASDERNMVALNNLAWYLRKSDPKQALAYAERANDIAPDSAPVLDTLALALLENKQVKDAQLRIEQALKLAPDDPGMRYHAALIRRAAGDKGGALLILEPVVNGPKDFPEKKEAAQLLESLGKK